MGSKANEAASYSVVAETFDRQAERWGLPFAERLCVVAGVGPGEQVLDVGCGTGLASRAAARRVGGGGKVLGVDIATEAIGVAERRGRREGLVPHILRFEEMDAEQLDLPDGSVDVVVSLHTVLHLADPRRALRDMRRVLRPGGRLAIGVGSGPPRWSPWSWPHLARRVRDRAANTLGRRAEMPNQLLGMLDAYLPPCDDGGTEGAGGLTPGPELSALVEDAGFGALQHSWRGRIDEVDSPVEFFDLQASVCSPARYRIQCAPLADVERLRRAVIDASWKVLDRGGKLIYPHGVWYLAARAV